MVRVQPEKLTDILVDEAMDSQYHEFVVSDNSFVHRELKMPTQKGLGRLLNYSLYAILVVLLLILLMVTGIRFSQLSKEVSDLKVLLEKNSNGAVFSPSVSDAPHVAIVYLEKLVPVRGTCRDGWVSFQRSCYLLSTTTVTWSTAEERCRTHGGHLVVLNSEEELDYISRVAEVREFYWIGLVERQHEGHWSWVDGTDFNSTPTFWDEGQPDNWDYRENGEDCGLIHGYEKRRRKMWNDADCNLLYRYICETRA